MRLDVIMIAGRNVLIVSICLPIGVGFTLRSNTHRAAKVLGMREGPVLLHVGAMLRSKTKLVCVIKANAFLLRTPV
jgi:hypothetical protein